MYKNLINNDENVNPNPLQAFLNFIRMGEYAFGVSDSVKVPLNQSLASAYEVEEDPYTINLSDDTIDDDSDTTYFCETPESSSRTSKSSSIPSLNGKTFLPDLISLSPVTSIESIHSACLDKSSNIAFNVSQSNDLEAAEPSNIYSSKNANSFNEDTIAQVVHDLVFDRYQVTYQRLLQKLRKVNLTEEETKFKNVVDELQIVLKENTSKKHIDMGTIDVESSMAQTKIYPDTKPIYSSTDSEVELELKPIGVPNSGKLNTSFTKASDSKKSENQSCIEDNLKKYLNNNDVKDFCKYLSRLTDKKLAGPSNPVNAVVYACSVEEIHPDCSNMAANSTNDTSTTLVNNSMQSSSLVHELAKNESFISDYDELNFLKTALGDELMKTTSSNEYIMPPTSVGTDDISELLSSTSTAKNSTKRRCKPKMSANTSVNYINPKPVHKAIDKTKSTNNKVGLYSSYENITNYEETISANKEKKLIKSKIFVHESIIDQAEKALEYGLRKSRGFVGSPAHLEIERTFLVSKIRRQALINMLYKVRDAPNDALGRVSIENLRCTMNSTGSSTENYYVCILQYNTTVYSTKIAAPNRLGWIDFDGCFTFDNVPNTFNIKVELYSIQFSEINQKCFRVPFLKSTPQLPMMKLMGDTVIGIMNKNEKLTLIPSDGGKFGEHKLTALIHTSIKWPDTLRGFITIGIEKHDQPSIWNRRWCVLEDGKLNYYNYPSDENYCKPIGVLDMQNCRSCDENNKRYLRQKTLALFIDNKTEVVTYYLGLDNTEEFSLWHKNVEMVLKLIREWNFA